MPLDGCRDSLQTRNVQDLLLNVVVSVIIGRLSYCDFLDASQYTLKPSPTNVALTHVCKHPDVFSAL